MGLSVQWPSSSYMHFAKSGLIGYHFDTNARPQSKGEWAFDCLWT